MHLYAELKPNSLADHAVSQEILREQLSIYFRYIDKDYKYLMRIMGYDPLKITILRCGTFAACLRTGCVPRRMNPPSMHIQTLLASQQHAIYSEDSAV